MKDPSPSFPCPTQCHRGLHFPNCFALWLLGRFGQWEALTDVGKQKRRDVPGYLSFFGNLFIFNWRIITLRYCVGFCRTSTCISHWTRLSLFSSFFFSFIFFTLSSPLLFLSFPFKYNFIEIQFTNKFTLLKSTSQKKFFFLVYSQSCAIITTVYFGIFKMLPPEKPPLLNPYSLEMTLHIPSIPTPSHW